jgi:small conductance mechanosensitive channel
MPSSPTSTGRSSGWLCRHGVVLALDLLNAHGASGHDPGRGRDRRPGHRFRGARHGRELHFLDHAVDPAAVPAQGPGGDRGRLGHVIRLTSRATILLSLDGNHIRIPNATVFKAKIINYSRNDERRFTFALGIDPMPISPGAGHRAAPRWTNCPSCWKRPRPGSGSNGLGASTIDLTARAGSCSTRHRSAWPRARPSASSRRGWRKPGSACRSRPTACCRRPARRPRRRPAPAPCPQPRRPPGRSAGCRHRRPGLEDLIEAEREALPDDDLLRREAPQE